ncbi:hypothetical protein OJF2_65400 [Aquisphaera giovannonii]|uniref:Uncharacterized protein n=1 Tax=Aquisphaera giovannonii TaxID=406548 RepID=A0A5B9WCE7_9BACT|nr:hypothetical protein OJF2_65400 [Aquisphaera giovannonii]
MHRQIRRENNVLFRAAVALERSLRGRAEPVLPI